MKFKIRSGDWFVEEGDSDWAVLAKQPNGTAISVAEDMNASDALAISRVPKMLKLLAALHSTDSNPTECDMDALKRIARALLAGLVEGK